MNENIEQEMMNRDHTWRLVKASGFAAVAIAGIVATCCVQLPRSPPDKTEAEQCATLCGLRPVTRFISSGILHTPPGQQDKITAMECECAGQVIVR